MNLVNRLLPVLMVLVLLLGACGAEQVSNSTPAPPSPAPVTSAAPTTAAQAAATAPPTAVPTAAPSPTPAPIPTATAVPTATKPALSLLPYLLLGNPSNGGSLRYPYDGAIDKAGNLYVADNITQQIVQFGKDGKFVKFLKVPETYADYGRPEYLALDGANNLYVSFDIGKILKFSLASNKAAEFGDPDLGSISSITTDAQNNVYTVTYQDYLVKYSADGKTLAKYQAKPSGDAPKPGEFNDQSKVRIAPDGNVFLFETSSPSRVQKFSPDFKYLNGLDVPKDKDGSSFYLGDLLFDADGNILLASSEHFWKFDKAGKLVSDTPTSFYNLKRLLSGPDGLIQVSSAENKTGKVDPSGKVELVFGKSNADAPGEFHEANSLAVDQKGNFYVGDGYGGRIQKFDQNGKVLTTFTEKTAGKSLSPYSLALDKDDNIYTPTGSGSIIKLKPNGQGVTTFGEYGDKEGQIQTASGLVVDSNGNLFVGDTGQGVVNKFGPSGIYVSRLNLKENSSDRVYQISLALDRDENLYVGRGSNNGILVFGKDGTKKGPLGPNNKLATELDVGSLAVTADGTVYALDISTSHPLVVLDKTGQIKSSFGGRGLKSLEFVSPTSLAVDSFGNIYVTDGSGARVQRWNLNDSKVKQGQAAGSQGGTAVISPGKLETQAGSPSAGSTGAATRTPAATSAAGSGKTPSLPAFSGTSEVALSPAVRTLITKGLPPINDLQLKLYVSDDDEATLAEKTDSAFRQAGYVFSFPGETKPTKQGNGTTGFYMYGADYGVIMGAIKVPSSADNLDTALNLKGLSPEETQKFYDQIKGKQSILFIVAAPALLNSLFSGNSGSATTAPAPSPTP